jgi:hypothetical protein
MISTRRRLEFASGYIGLGLLSEASEELEMIAGPDRLSVEVMRVRAELYLRAENWELLLAVCRELTRLCPDEERGWIHAAYALRELNRVVEAKAVLLEAEPRHGPTSGLLHYNLACYHSLLGEMPAAKTQLAIACRMDATWRRAALNDRDLEALWDEIAVME